MISSLSASPGTDGKIEFFQRVVDDPELRELAHEINVPPRTRPAGSG